MTTMRSVVAIVGLELLGVASSQAQTVERTPVTKTPRFAFYNDVATNLNDALIHAGSARRARRPELFQTRGDSECFAELPASVRAGWNRAVDYYAEIIAPADWLAPQQFLLRVDLGGFPEELTDTSARQFATIARAFRAAATPAYEACRWSTQSVQNRQVIDEIHRLLTQHEQPIAARLEQLYQSQWNGPIRADMVETVNWSGANSTSLDRGGAHILVSTSQYSGLAALELVFHEGSHVLMNRSSPVRTAVDSAAALAGVRTPDDLWHAVMFYITGETVRSVLAEAGTTGYTPMIYEIFGRTPWGAHRASIESAWKPYVEGKRTLPQATAEFAAAIRAAARR